MRHVYSSQAASNDLNLHLIIPATAANPNFCRTALTAALLDYPTPILVNWEGKVDSENRFATHLAKIDSILEYLHGLSSRNDNDLILIVDGYDVWFQLRPEVLIQRYYAAIAKGNQRLAADFDPDVLDQHGIQQSVLFGADKKCWPQDEDSLICNVIPESSLPKDAFGSETDSPGDNSHARPRWVNSGTILGPVAEVRAIFEAASRRVQNKFHGYSDQYYFAEIFGEQELRRNSLSRVPKDLKKYLPKDRRKHAFEDIEHDTEAELHISMDYEAYLFHTNAFAVDDTEWTVFNTTTTPTSDVVTDETSSRLPDDINQSRPPVFKGIIAEELFAEDKAFAKLPFDTTWADVPLLFNKITGNIPVILHMNGDKSLLNEWWGQLWWAGGGWGKHLLQSSSRAPRGPLASFVDNETGKVTRWWKGSYNSLRRENGGYWTSKGHWVFYDDVCAKHGDVLYQGKPTAFHKGKGGWLGPPSQIHRKESGPK